MRFGLPPFAKARRMGYPKECSMYCLMWPTVKLLWLGQVQRSFFRPWSMSRLDPLL